MILYEVPAEWKNTIFQVSYFIYIKMIRFVCLNAQSTHIKVRILFVHFKITHPSSVNG